MTDGKYFCDAGNSDLLFVTFLQYLCYLFFKIL